MTSMTSSVTTVTDKGSPKTTSSKGEASAAKSTDSIPAASSTGPVKVSGTGAAGRKEVSGGVLFGALLVMAF